MNKNNIIGYICLTFLMLGIWLSPIEIYFKFIISGALFVIIYILNLDWDLIEDTELGENK